MSTKQMAKDPELERAIARLSSFKEQLEKHRAKPMTTQEWKMAEENLVKQVVAAEGEMAKLSGQRGIVGA
jgi:hypothetical protein